jgi:hypothetical protein
VGTKGETVNKSAEEILSCYKDRKTKAGPVMTRMVEVRDATNGDMVVPGPELDGMDRNVVANKVQTGIDQEAQRIASTTATVRFPVDRLGSKASEDRARDRRDVLVGWREGNRMPFRTRRRARHLIAYSTTPVMIRPDDQGLPKWFLRDPLGTFPATGADPDEIVPTDTIFAVKRSRDWLMRTYPEQCARLKKGRDETFDILEYVDGDELVVVAGGSEQDTSGEYGLIDGNSPAEILHRVPNKAGCPLAIVPHRVTLDRPMGQYDSIIDLYFYESMMASLGLLAQKRAIFPETWLISQGTTDPEIIEDADPLKGIIGVAKNGAMTQIRQEPSAQNNTMIDRFEYGQRTGGFIPAEIGGSGSQNVRTGRRGAQVLGATMDFPIQEAQAVLEQSEYEENRVAIEVAKAYGGRKQFSMYSMSRGKIDYNPRTLYPNTFHEVRYAYLGSDANGAIIAAGQKIGVGMLSKRSAMEQDPTIPDVESEMDRITAEALRTAHLSSIQTLASNPEGPWQPADLALLERLVLSDKMELPAAVEKVNLQAQERQAKAQAAAQPTAEPMPAGPEQMPGIGTPEAPGVPEAIPEVGPSTSHLSRLLHDLRSPQRQTPAEMTA